MMNDLISRQASILQLSHNKCGNDENDIAVQHDIETIKTLPTIQPVVTDTNVGDTISRKAAFEALTERSYEAAKRVGTDSPFWEGIVIARRIVNNLPPAQPEPKEGHWIKHETPDGGEQYECSECGVLWEFNYGTPEDNEAYFCPKCGERMRGAQNG